MNVIVKLNDNFRSELITLYSNELEKINLRRNELIDFLAQLNSNIQMDMTISPVSVFEPATAQAGNIGGTWTERTIYVLLLDSRAKSTRYIVDKICELDPILDKGLVLRSISSVISTKIKENKVFDRYEDVKGEFKIGLKEWFSSKGKIKEEFKSLN